MKKSKVLISVSGIEGFITVQSICKSCARLKLENRKRWHWVCSGCGLRRKYDSRKNRE